MFLRGLRDVPSLFTAVREGFQSSEQPETPRVLGRGGGSGVPWRGSSHPVYASSRGVHRAITWKRKARSETRRSGSRSCVLPRAQAIVARCVRESLSVGRGPLPSTPKRSPGYPNPHRTHGAGSARGLLCRRPRERLRHPSLSARTRRELLPSYREGPRLSTTGIPTVPEAVASTSADPDRHGKSGGVPAKVVVSPAPALPALEMDRASSAHQKFCRNITSLARRN